MIFKEFRQRGFLREISRLFNQQTRARQLLTTLGYPGDQIPAFDNSLVFWTTVAQELEGGIMPQDDLGSLVQHAADYYPGNQLLSSYAVSSSQAPVAAPTSSAPSAAGVAEGCSVILGPPPPGEDAAGLQGRVGRLCRQLGIDAAFELMQVLEDGQLELYFPNTHAEALVPLQEALRDDGIRSRLIDDRHRDRLLSHLLVEGPDQARYRFSNVPASTQVGEIARALINEHYDSNWPKDRRDKPRQATVDHVDSQGNERRLRPDDRLDDSRVEDGATLQVHPESTAGALNQTYKQEALVRAKNQVLRYARGHGDFRVRANSTQAPTEYVIEFEAPDLRPGEPGTGRVRHAVLLQLPDEFPSQAPAAWWQPPVIFHPNIHRGTGKVCLGVLDDRYRPGLDFGRLCQMLVDVAGFRNYVVTEGYNIDACRWAASPEGQATILAGGGRPEDPAKLAQARGHRQADDELPGQPSGLGVHTRIEKLQ